MMGHAFEMLFKAAIIQRGGSITKTDWYQTLSLRECLRVATSQAGVRFISAE
ncbi:MAG: hypothetical protein OXH40_14760 [Chloroflexi bacterium]|nr:hypothetical protein [Chloroflexota bacterium]MDE2709979.1 hypothetical protein [Chloroflexota bacterium]